MDEDLVDFARIAGITPLEGESLPWHRSREAVGIELPTDYREFVDAFGSGELGGYIAIDTPPGLRDPSMGISGLRSMLWHSAMDLGPILRGLRDDYPEAFPYPFYPEPAGLLPWAHGIGGELFFWQTEDDDPNEWPVVIWDKAEWREYNTGMASVLILMISGGDPFLRRFLESEAPIWTPHD